MEASTQCKIISGIIFYVVYVAVMLYAYGFTGWALLHNIAPVITIATLFLIGWSIFGMSVPCVYICNREEIEEEIKREEDRELEFQRSSEGYYKRNANSLTLSVMDSPYPWGTIPYDEDKESQSHPNNYGIFVI